jgi:tRNA 2-thiouridine synthesizing protein A
VSEQDGRADRDDPGIGPPTPDEVWDAGALGCGELVLELRSRMARLQPGQLLRLIARDPGAPADLPAWSRLTGHPLVSAVHPVYCFRRKET